MKRFFLGFALAFFVACDDESSFAPRDEDSSSSVCEDCDDSSSSVKSSSSKKETSSSSNKEQGDGGSSAAMTSSSAKSSSSKKETSSSSRHSGLDPESSSTKGDGGSEAAMTSSSAKSSSSVTPKSSSSSTNVSSSSAKSSSSAPLSSSEYVPFDHSNTLAGAWRIGENRYSTFTDPRNGRSYYYITIYSEYKGYSVTVMAENLNIGDMVLGENDQNDDTKIERYCYNNDTTKCDEFGGLYQWAEMMQLPSRCNTESCAELIQENHQGICPDGWRLFTYDDYCVVMGYDDPYNDGVKGLRSTYGFSGTNNSGFSLVGAGLRRSKGEFAMLRDAAYWAYPVEDDYNVSTYVHTGTISRSSDNAPGPDDGGLKKVARSVRCVMVEKQTE